MRTPPSARTPLSPGLECECRTHTPRRFLPSFLSFLASTTMACVLTQSSSFPLDDQSRRSSGRSSYDSLAPQFAGSRIGSANSKHTIELWLDYDCRTALFCSSLSLWTRSFLYRLTIDGHSSCEPPAFSAKQARGVKENLLPLLKPDQCSVILRQYPQPWHAPSTLMHEAAIAGAPLPPIHPHSVSACS